MLCDEVETIREFTYLGDRVSTGEGCEVAVTARIKCWWIKFTECGKMLYGKILSLILKEAVYKINVRPMILFGIEKWCQKER